VEASVVSNLTQARPAVPAGEMDNFQLDQMVAIDDLDLSVVVELRHELIEVVRVR
jgi:hypothetical protein